MRALLVAVGTRGDVQPVLALALELRKLGHSARLCISPNFVNWAESLGLEAVPLGVEMRMSPQNSKSVPTLTAEQLRQLRESMPDLIRDQFETLGAAVGGCDIILGGNAHQYAAPSIAERAGICHVTAVYAPVALPSTELAPAPMPGSAAVAAESMSIEEQWRNTARAWNERALERVNQNRARLGMTPIADTLEYVLGGSTWLAADAALAPVPATPGRQVFQTGGWVLPDARTLPAELEAFLERGEPPIFVGFGSMPAGRDVTRQLVAAARAVGRRLVVSRGWAELELDSDSDCIAIGDVNYDVLFPQVAAVVHHGGAGTTATAARAGVPQLVTPMFNDQFYWAGRVAALGIGATIPHSAIVAAESLAAALTQVCEPAFTTRARALAQHVRRDGAEIAARRLDSMALGRD